MATKAKERADNEVAQLWVPPHSLEAEHSVLGDLLLDNTAWDRAGDLLVGGDFYRYEHDALPPCGTDSRKDKGHSVATGGLCHFSL